MHYLFYTHCSTKTTFNADISSWDTSGATDMFGMFRNAKVFNQDVGVWDVSKVTSMFCMFEGAIIFDQNVGAWDISQVRTMAQMFRNANAFNQNVGAWEISQVTTLDSMFYEAFAFNQAIGGWDVSNVANTGYMFYSVAKFNQVLCWDLAGKTTTNMFYNSPGSADPSAAQCSCDAGTYYTAWTCASCLVGQYSYGKSTACLLCPAGQYQASAGSTACSACPKGSVSKIEGASSCSLISSPTSNPTSGPDWSLSDPKSRKSAAMFSSTLFTALAPAGGLGAIGLCTFVYCRLKQVQNHGVTKNHASFLLDDEFLLGQGLPLAANHDANAEDGGGGGGGGSRAEFVPMFSPRSGGSSGGNVGSGGEAGDVELMDISANHVMSPLSLVDQLEVGDV
jgi:hypothetical protein